MLKNTTAKGNEMTHQQAANRVANDIESRNATATNDEIARIIDNDWSGITVQERHFRNFCDKVRTELTAREQERRDLEVFGL